MTLETPVAHDGNTSFAMLMNALGESSRVNGADVQPAHASSEWWAQKKRKRAISCGRCEACCREDCGKCLNCLDKPKFGGQGIRKQSCLSRKCLNAAPNGAAHSNAAAASHSATKIRPESDMLPMNSPAGMSATEMRDFWGAVQCCMQLADDSGAQRRPFFPIEAIEERISNAKRAKASNARQARCGSCAGCTRGDCGECKNCLDKPKYGGRGIKKQACLRRACLAAEPEFDEEEPAKDSATVAAAVTLTAEGGFLSRDASPALKPTEPAAEIPPAEISADEPMLPTKLAHVQLLKQQLDAQDKPGTAYSTADEEEASEDAAQALIMASRNKSLSSTSLLASAARICYKRDASHQVDEPFTMMLGAAAVLPKTAVA